MMLELNSRIVIDPAILVGKPIVRGTRISVQQVLGHLADGWTADEIVEEYPSLTLNDIAACLGYARDLVAEEVIVPSAA